MDNRVFTLAVVALVVLSGCAALGGDGSTATPADADETATQTETADEAATATPSDTPTPWATETATPTATATSTATATPTAVPQSTPAGDLEPVSAMSSLPPGIEDGAVTNVSALAAENQRLLTVGGVDLRMTFENSSAAGTDRFRIANDTASSLLRLTESQGSLGASTDMSVYLDADEAGVYNRTSGEVAYGSGPTTTRSGAQFITGLVYYVPQAYVAAPDWETAGSYTADDGEERLVLHADALRDPAERGTDIGGVADRDEEVRSVDARMEVTPDGLVRSLNVTLDVETSSGATYTQTVSMSSVDIEPGSLAQPEWLSDAPHLSASTTAGGELLVIEHTGGPAIEAGTNLSVTGGRVPLGNVSADRQIAEGDTLYVYATGEDRDRTLHLAVNERPTLPENATAFSGRVGIRGSQGDHEFAAAVELATDGSSDTTGA